MKKNSFIALFIILVLGFAANAFAADIDSKPIEQDINRVAVPRTIQSPIVTERTITTFPWVESFEDATFPPTDWIIYNPDGTVNPTTQSDTQAKTGTYSLRFSSMSHSADHNRYARSPEIDLTGLTNPTLRFWARKHNTNPEELYVGISTTLTDSVQNYTNWVNVTSILTNTEFNSYELDLSAYAGQTIHIGFKYYGDYLYYVYLDDVEVYDNVTPPPCATVDSPTDGETDLLTDITLSWNAADGATSYDLYLGESTGNYNIENGTSVSGLTHDFTATLGMTYYWKVVPVNANGSATECAEWSFETFSTTPACAANLVPVDAAVDQSENGTLSWDASFSATEYLLSIGTSTGSYNILDHATVTGTSYNYSGLAYGTQYFWQVTPVNGLGPNMTCAEQSFTIRNDPTIVGAWSTDFESGIPADWINDTVNDLDDWAIESGSIGYAATSDHTSGSGNYLGFDDSYPNPDNAFITTTPFDVSGMSNPTLSFWYWIGSPASTADQSTLYMDTYDGSTWTEYPVSWTHTPQWTEQVIDLSGFTTVTIRFRAMGTDGYESDICIDDFTIYAAGNPPTCSTTSVPADQATGLNSFGTISWNNPGQTDYFTLYFGSSTGNYDIVNGMTLTATSYDYSGLDYSSAYFWKVVPGNAHGDATGCPEWSFITMDDPTISTFPWTEDLESGTPPAGWTIIDDDLTTNPVTMSTTQNHTADGSTSIRFSSYSYASSGEYAQYLISPPVDLSTVAAPAVSFWHYLSSSYGDDMIYLGVSTTNTDTTSFTWTNFTDDLQVAWTEAVVNLSAYEGQTVYIALKYDAPGSDYYIYVDDMSIYSNAVPPSCTTVIAPADAAVDQLDSGTLSWDEDNNADFYKVYIGTATDTYNVLNGASVTTTSYDYTLSPAQTYFWKIVPGNTYGDAAGCPEWTFSTVAVTPNCASYVAPADAATDVWENGTLDWDTADYASTYNLYFGTASGTYDIVNGMALTATSYDYSGLTYGNTYYWMVVPENAVGPATGCAEQSFTIRANPTITVFPWLEEFTSWTPTNWALSGDRTWAQYGGEAAYCNFWGWSDGTAIMTTPPVQLPATGNWALNFDWSHQYNTSYPDDQGIVQISTDGSNWTELWNLTGAAFESNDGAGSMAPGTGVTETFPLDAYLGQTVFFQVVGVSGYGPNFFVDNFGVNTYVPPTAKAMVNVFLGGAYSADNDNMNTTLNGFLPLTSPYADGIAVTAMPTDVVDWISVELRQTADGATIEQRSGLLLDSGMIVDVAYETDNTVDYINFTTAIAGDYFVVVRHRNHSDIMSAAAAALPADPATATAVDFTTDAANAYTSGPAALYEAETGVYVMYPGDIDGNGSIIASDATLWQTAFTAGVADGYHYEDIDMDGSVIAGDNSVWKIYFTAGAPDSQVPDNSTAAASVFSERKNRVNRINISNQKTSKRIAR